MNEKEIANRLQELSELEEEIKSKIDRYNRLSNQSDNSTRLALMIAVSEKSDYESYDDNDEENLNEDILTHEQYVMEVGRPYPTIYRGGANGWFPSSIC